MGIPRTHDLEGLQILCDEFIQSDAFSHLALGELSDYAVSVRYDFEFWPDVGTAAEAIMIAEEVRLFAEKLLL
jgi:hypothetical protein